MVKLSKSNTYSMLTIICFVISTGCLAAGYVFAGYWQIFLIFLLLLNVWLLTYKQSLYLSASTFLTGYVIMAVVGILLDISVILMTTAGITVLVSWELLLFNRSHPGNFSGNRNLLREKYHLRSLALTATVGLALALISAYINLHIPFIVIVCLVLISIGCLVYGVQFNVKIKH